MIHPLSFIMHPLLELGRKYGVMGAEVVYNACF